MKTFFSDIIPKIKKYSEKLDNLTLLMNNHWVIIDEINTAKYVYIFRDNSQLLIVKDGVVEKGKWEYLGNNSLLVDRNDMTFLFRHGFLDSNVLILKVDGREEYAFMINESKFEQEINTLSKVLNLLENQYLNIIPNITLNIELPSIPVKYKYKLNKLRNEKDKVGFVDSSGSIVIDYIFDGADDFSEGYAPVYKTINNRDYYGFINEQGNLEIDYIYEYAESFSNGLSLVRLNRNFGYINCKGDVIIPFRYDYASSFKEGKALVKLNNRKLIIDIYGNEI
jgi:hypothetical protein